MIVTSVAPEVAIDLIGVTGLTNSHLKLRRVASNAFSLAP